MLEHISNLEDILNYKAYYANIICLGCSVNFTVRASEIRHSINKNKNKSKTFKFCKISCKQNYYGFGKTKVICINCNKQFEKTNAQIKKHNNNFCSQNCAAEINNKLFPKKKKKQFFVCFKCKNNTSKKYRRLCANCKASSASKPLDQNQTLAQIRNARKYQKSSQVRNSVRKKYEALNLPNKCYRKGCDYVAHIDVCHIKAIKDFDPSTPLHIVNNFENLITLCKNHHWEFDNGKLTIDDLEAPNLSSVISNK